ncbi:MAG: histidine kinase [Crocinitomicaceae bacterium]
MKSISRQEKYDLIGFNDVKLRLILVPILSYFFPIIVMDLNPNDSLYPEAFVISLLHIVGYWEFDRHIVIRLRKKYQAIDQYKERLVIQTIIIGSTTIGFCLFSKSLQFCFSSEMMLLNISLFSYLVASLIITILILSIYEARFAFTQWKNHLVKNEKLEKENSQAQLEVLKNQVNPHFFFNSINTLISVIPEDPTTAVKFAENLSSVYRYILQMKDKEIVSLEEEFNCIEAYKYLLKIRFGDHLIFHCDDHKDFIGKFIVPLSVQMLIENCIKHNVVSKTHPLEIRIRLTEDYLSVSNKIQPKIQPEESTKVGLENIQKRYELLMEKSIEIVHTAESFEVRLPIVKLAEVK